MYKINKYTCIYIPYNGNTITNLKWLQNFNPPSTVASWTNPLALPLLWCSETRGPVLCHHEAWNQKKNTETHPRKWKGNSSKPFTFMIFMTLGSMFDFQGCMFHSFVALINTSYNVTACFVHFPTSWDCIISNIWRFQLENSRTFMRNACIFYLLPVCYMRACFLVYIFGE